MAVELDLLSDARCSFVPCAAPLPRQSVELSAVAPRQRSTATLRSSAPGVVRFPIQRSERFIKSYAPEYSGHCTRPHATVGRDHARAPLRTLLQVVTIFSRIQ